MQKNGIKTIIILQGILLSAFINAQAQGRNPNIVLILSDDYGYGSSTCYGADPALIHTPNIDRLAAEGRRFTDANTTSSVCAPTRYSVLTGRYCWRTSLKHEVLGTTSPLHIEPDRLNLASLLKKHGYKTAAVGKWHLGYGDAPVTDYTNELKPGPLEIGFDYHLGVPANHGDIAGIYVENHRVVGLRSAKLSPGKTGKNFKNKPFLGLDAPHRVDEEVMPFITTRAIEWLERQSSDKPFFLYFTPVAIHSPVTPSVKTKGSSKAGPYGDWIHELDLSVGRVLDTLDRKGFTQNTLVLFTSDNGGVFKPTKEGEATDAYKAGLKISGPFRGGKHDVWEGGFRVPYLLRWPGHVPARTVCDETLSLSDTLATVAALVGEPLPAVGTAAEDSYNMLPAWLDKKYSSPIRRDLIVHSADGNFAIRRGDWKWIEGVFHPATRSGALKLRRDQFRKQLYNLSDDIAESRDRIENCPEMAAELEQLLERYRNGGYSRELPPPIPPRPKRASLSPITQTVIYSSKFTELPEVPWSIVRGKWRASDGVLYGRQDRRDKIGAAVRTLLNQRDCDITYELTLPLFATHTLRLQSHQPNKIFLVNVTPRNLSIVCTILHNFETEHKSATHTTLAEEKLNFEPDEWQTMRVNFRGAEMAVQLGDAILRVKDEILREPKCVMALMAGNDEVRFRKLKIYGEGSIAR